VAMATSTSRTSSAQGSSGGTSSNGSIVSTTQATEVVGSCSGAQSCIADVKGYNGTKLVWKSDCGGYAYTVLDGENEYATFYCNGTQPPVEIVSEQVKCVFSGNGSEGPTQKCYTTDYAGYPNAYCSGTESCVIDVKGPKGKELGWESSCKGYATTRLDGESEYATFECGKSRGGQTYTINAATGWNIVSYPAYSFEPPTGSCSATTKGDSFTYYWYNKSTGKYEKVSSTKAGEAYWLHNSGGPCSIEYKIKEPVPLSSLPELGKGWNFVAIVPDMIGSSIESLGDCNLKSAYSYNAESRKWVPEIGSRITEADLGKGFVVNSNNACSLAVASGPPPLPD